MHLLSWNVNGLRAVQKKGFAAWLSNSGAQVVALQETKAHPDQLDEELLRPPGYHSYWASAAKKGYSGLGLYSQIVPQQVTVGLGLPEFDDEGRTQTLDYGAFVLVNAYFPSGSAKPEERVPYKLAYCAAFLRHIEALRAQGRSIVFCGDINIAHQPIDLARPKDNTKTSGFLPEERAWLDELQSLGYIDIFRHLHPDTVQYTWWSSRGAAPRANNIGWRIDHFWISPDLLERVTSATIHTDTTGSDHCPISLHLDI